jgi:hypothetical protein
MTEEERAARRKQMLERMTPEERKQWEERMAQRGQGGGRGQGPGGNFQRGEGNQRGQGGQQRAQGGNQGQNPGGGSGDSSIDRTTATTVDALFAPLPPTEGRGRVWLFANKQLKSIAVRTGITDGTWTEIIETPDTAPLTPNTEVVINLVTGLEPVNRPGQQGAGSPLMPQRGQQPGRGGPGGGGGGRGR